MIARWTFFRTLTLLIFCAATAGCGVLRPVERSTSYLLIPPKAEAEMGREYAEQISEEYSLVDDQEAQQWLDQVGAKLVEHSRDSAQDFNFAFTESPEVNAFAIPGGFCYVNLGLVLYADNEAQVAAVVAHEINHVTGRHGIMNMQRAMGIGAVANLLLYQFKDPRARAVAGIAAQGGTVLAMRNFSRADEREADRWGVQAMYKAGYDPRQAAAFFEKLAQLHGGGTPGWLSQMMSTHPATMERVNNIRRQTEGYDLSKDLVVDTPEFRALQEKLRAAYPDVRF